MTTIDHTTHMIFVGTVAGARLAPIDTTIIATTDMKFIETGTSLVLLNTDGNIYHVFPIGDTPEAKIEAIEFRQQWHAK